MRYIHNDQWWTCDFLLYLYEPLCYVTQNRELSIQLTRRKDDVRVML